MATQPIEQQEASGAEADNDAEIGQVEQQERDYEAEARAHGWVPKEEFKGDASRWTDAETFAKRADEVMPLLKKQNQTLKREMDELKKQFRRASEHFSKSEQRGYERAIADLKERQTAAVEAGDVKAHAAISKEIDDLREELPGTTEKAPAASPQEAMEALIDWRAENPWYDKGGVERDYADLLAEKHVDKTSEMAPADFFAFIQGEVEKKFPSVKEGEGKEPRKKPASAVEAPAGRANRGAKSFNDLPPEAQRMCDKWVANGIIKSRDDYVKTYQF